MGVVRKVGEFRHESRFTTWACKFAIFEVSTKGRPALLAAINHGYGRRGLGPSPGPLRIRPGPRPLEWGDVVAALRLAVDDDLTAHQRRIFVAIVLQRCPVGRTSGRAGLESRRDLQTLFDARRKLRTALVTHGYLDDDIAGES